MKKSILMLAFSALVGGAFALSSIQEGTTKKSCTASQKASCKKSGQVGKSCDKKSEKAEVKATDVKTVEATTETKK